MKSTLRLSACAAYLGLLCCTGVAQETTLIQDSLTNRDVFTDLTLLALWDANTSPTSGLQLVEKSDDAGLSYHAIKMADDAAPYSRWDQDLHASTAIDYTFAKVDRSNTTIVVECDVIWDELESGRKGKWGEGNRFVVALLHDYPPKGPQFGDLSKTQAGHPFGRPAYHYRIRNIRVGMGSMMSYGGGAAGPLGEFERYSDGSNTYWLPGFISSPAKGQAPGDERTYDGKKSPYPIGPTQKGGRVASDREWQHLTWKVYPERLELYCRATKDPAASDRLVFFMDTPRSPEHASDKASLCERLAASHGLPDLRQLPPLYNWFPSFEAARFYFRGNKTYLANVRITAVPANPEEPNRGAEQDESSVRGKPRR